MQQAMQQQQHLDDLDHHGARDLRQITEQRFWRPLAVGLLTLGLLTQTFLVSPASADEGISPWRIASLAEGGEALPPLPDFPVQLVLDDDAAESSFGVGFPAARQFLWFNQFDRGAVGAFALEEIWVLFPPGNNVVPGAEVELVVYLDPDGDPTNGAQLLASYTETIQIVDGQTFSVYPLAMPLEIPDGGEVLIGVINRFVESGVTGETLPAAIDTSASQGRSWVAVWNGDPPAAPDLPSDNTFQLIDSFVPGNWMIRGFGTPVDAVPVIEVPTLGGLGLALLVLLLAVAGLRFGRRSAGQGGGVAALGLFLLLAAGPARGASTTIDDFSVAQGPVSLTDPADVVGDVTNDTAAAGLGGERGIRLELLAVSPTVGVSVEATGGELIFAADAGARGAALLSWDGTDGDPATLDTATGLGGVDLTGGGTESGLLVAIGSADAAGLEIEVEVHSSATNASRFALVLPMIGAATDVICGFSDFVASGSAGAADFTSVNAVTLVLRGSDINAVLDRFATAPPELLAANVTKSDVLLDLDADLLADPGERIRYTVTVQNTGALVDGLSLGGLLDDANASAVAGTLHTTPLAFRDTYEGCGNFTLVVDGIGFPGVLANDFDPENGDNTGLVVASFDAASAQGGTIQNTNLATGTFEYVPPAGFKGIDSFGYVLEDTDGNQVPGEVVVSVDSLVWFLGDDDDTGPFNGTQANPFNSLSQAEVASGPGDILYVVSDNGTIERLTDSIVLKDGQQLIGGGVAFDVCGITLPAGIRPGITDTTSEPAPPADPATRPQGTRWANRGVLGTPVVTLANGNTIRGLDIVATQVGPIGGFGIQDVTVSDVVIDKSGVAEGPLFVAAGGTLDFDNITIQGSATFSSAFNFDTSMADFDCDNCTIDLSAGALFYAEGDASTVDFNSGSMSLTTGGGFPAIELVNNTGTYNFTTLGAVGTSQVGILADNGGTLTAPATASVASTGNAALQITNGTVSGVDPLTLASVSSTGTSSVGIELANFAQGLTVTGAVTVSSSSHGIIAVTTGTLTMTTASNSVTATGGPALSLNNANVSLAFATLSSSGSPAEAIDLDMVSGPITVSNAASSLVNSAAAATVDINGGSGTFTYPGTITQNGAGSSVRVQNRSSGVHTFSGAIDDNGGGVLLASNTGSTFTFSGGLDIDSGTSTGFAATGGGTVNVLASGVSNTIDVNGAPHALDLNGIGIGASDMTFTTINGTNTTAEGLDIDAVTNAGAFFGGNVTVNGTGMGFAGINIAGSSAAFDFTSATVDNTGGAGIDLSGANGTVLFDTVDIDGAAGAGVQVAANSNTVVLDAGSIGAATTSGGDGVAINGGSADITIDATVRQTTANNSIDIQNRIAGTVLLNGAITDTAGGILLASNGAGIVTFRGGMALDTGANTAFSATTSGTVNVCPTTLCSGGGSAVQNRIGSNTPLSQRAVEIDTATIGGEGVTFRTISVSGAGTGTTAIRLADSGAGFFAVTGDGSASFGGNASGGTIQGISTGDGILLDNTDGLVSFQNMTIQDISHPSDGTDVLQTRRFNDGIHGENVNGGLRLQSVTMRRFSDHAVLGALFSDGTDFTSWDGLELRDSLFELANRFHVAGRGDDADEGVIRIRGLTGTMVVDNCTIQDGGRGLDIYTPSGAGTLDATIQRSTFEDLYKEFASGATRNVGGRGVSFEARGSHDMVVRIGDPAQTNPALGNTFTNNFTASVVVLGQEGGMDPHTGDIDTVISRNNFVITDHTTAQLPFGNLTFDFPQGGVSLNPAGGTYDAIVSHNLFDEVMHAAGGLGQLTLGLNGGAVQAHVHDNTFRLPWDGSVQIRAEGTDSAAVLFEDNIYEDGMVGSATDDVGFAAQSPFNPFLVNVRTGGDLDLTMRREVFPQHDTVFTPADRKHSIEIEVQADSAANALDLHLVDNQAPEGYHFKENAGSFELFVGVSGSGVIPTIVRDNGNRGGGSVDTTDPPTVVVTGGVSTTATAPTLPVIVIP